MEALHTGVLVAVDTFFVGALKGVGKVYLQTALDCLSSCSWAMLNFSKLPVTAVHLMNTDVLPTFAVHNARIHVVLSDNGQEYCGRLTESILHPRLTCSPFSGTSEAGKLQFRMLQFPGGRSAALWLWTAMSISEIKERAGSAMALNQHAQQRPERISRIWHQLLYVGFMQKAALPHRKLMPVSPFLLARMEDDHA